MTSSAIEHHYVQVNGIRMHYAKAGHGEKLLVLLHGFPECWYSWRHQLAAFSDEYTVVAPDMRGYNETDAPQWGYELDVLVADIAELVHALGFDKMYLAGHDWGGNIAWSLAISRPYLVERLVALNIPHPTLFEEAFQGGNTRQMLRSWYIGMFQLPMLPELVLSANNFAFVEQAIRGMAVDKSRFSDEDIQIYKDALRKPGRLTAAINYYRVLMSQGPRGMFHGTGMRVAVPTLMIWGEQDTALGKELTYGTERFVPDLRIRYIPQCSHWVQQEQPELVTELMREFLAE